MRFNPYRIMWIMVVFDLPVQTKKQRHQANVFRKQLKSMGFFMHQYSVYFRCCGSRENMASDIKKVRNNLPKYGHVSVFNFTDKQYESVNHFYCMAEAKARDRPKQLTIF